MYADSNPVLTSQQNNCFVSAIGAAVARFPDTEEVTGSIPVSRTKENPLALRLRGFVFNFLILARGGMAFLLVPTGNPPSLRFGHPDVTTGDTFSPRLGYVAGAAYFLRAYAGAPVTRTLRLSSLRCGERPG